MTQVSDVLDCLMTYADMEGYTQQQLNPSCEMALEWIKGHLRSGAESNTLLITQTAAALAHYYFFMFRLSEPDKYEAYTAGDLTVRRNLEKEYLHETEIRNQALANASSILEDGGFYFSGT